MRFCKSQLIAKPLRTRKGTKNKNKTKQGTLDLFHDDLHRAVDIPTVPAVTPDITDPRAYDL